MGWVFAAFISRIAPPYPGTVDQMNNFGAGEDQGANAHSRSLPSPDPKTENKAPRVLLALAERNSNVGLATLRAAYPFRYGNNLAFPTWKGKSELSSLW
jgi:hypothetical protein